MVMGETISNWMWTGTPGAGSWHAAASALTQVVGQLTGIQGGEQANAEALSVAWASPTGAMAVEANTPYQAWLAQIGPQIDAMASLIAQTGNVFHAAQFATPNPGVFATDWHNIITTAHGLPLSFAAFFAALSQYATHTTQAMHAYFVTWMPASTSLVTTLLKPMPLPPVSAVPGAITPSMSGSMSGGVASAAAALPSGLGALPSGLGSLPSVGSAAAQPLSALPQVLSQAGSPLMSSGSALAQAPSSMASGLGGLPSSMAPPMSPGFGSPAAGSGDTGANSGNWIPAMSGEGGTVAAALSGGGAGTSGFGGTAAMAALRGPVSWASSADAAAPGGDRVVLSRFAEARAASTSATSSGMGAPGAMMPPARSASAKGEQESDATLASVAAPYRVPRNMPVVTGANGAQFVAGEEEDRYQIL